MGMRSCVIGMAVSVSVSHDGRGGLGVTGRRSGNR